MSSGFKFFVLTRHAPAPKSSQPFFLLRSDDWDDFGFTIQFHMSYFNENGEEVHIGKVKILQKSTADRSAGTLNKTTRLDNTFPELEETCISIGQGDRYYKNLHRYLDSQAGDVLAALRDIAWTPSLAADFEPTSGFRNALLRENGAQRARRFGKALAQGEDVTTKLSFTYLGSIEGSETAVEASFDFDPKDRLPGRIVGIIGRNAVGKTQFLASLANDLAQLSRTSAQRLKEINKRFPSGRPLFARIVTISYSAFDKFKRPTQEDKSKATTQDGENKGESQQVFGSYVYCGIRNDKGVLSRAALTAAYRANQERIRTSGEREQSKWARYMQTVLGDLSPQLLEALQREIQGSSTSEESALAQLSSGQSILAHLITALMAWIQPNSLVLFDEPETHLHPNAVASLFLVLSDILEEHDSYAVIATHSPLVIQEIPAKRVLMFRREQDVTVAEPLLLESFGETVTELTRHLFETNEVDSVYRRTLKALAKKEPAAAVMNRFEQGLSLSAQAYLLAQYGKKEG